MQPDLIPARYRHATKDGLVLVYAMKKYEGNRGTYLTSATDRDERRGGICHVLSIWGFFL
jgi:hypothetical protein